MRVRNWSLSWGRSCWVIGGRIGSEIESHAAYRGHWIELFKESPKVLFQVLSEGRQAVDLICPEAAGEGEHQGEEAVAN
ncbi:hypothetical protein [Synechococcus sp. CBW1107]|uniref:hypothetical protein n=1 Tax=Synechococcus sp. CBW1107 TaxID=2789857 RepID=UPI002AD39D16|nr:hypothetical protein [Synechococcus sp. CBW1107]CAK6692891.1 hypothetical protein ICNINCKA_01303 [Synechococcus sp. CBW1107]